MYEVSCSRRDHETRADPHPQPHPTLTLTLTLPQAFKDMVAAEYDASKVRDGVFGAMMDVR